MFKICILDYGLGNIQSLKNALKKIGFKPEFFSDKKSTKYDLIFIPGVGSYSAASKILNSKKYLNFLNKDNINSRIFGICLGMQMFSSKGYEIKESKGLNYIPGSTVKINCKNRKLILPFVGYFKTNFKLDKKTRFLNEFNNEKFYYVHSYALKPKNNSSILSLTSYQGVKYCSSVFKDRYIGTQFHPEKSGEIGLLFLKKIIKNLI